jgi:hypothetical protein
VTVDGVLDCQLDLLHLTTNYSWVSQFFNHQLCRLRSLYLSICVSILDISMSPFSIYSAATWPLLYSLGPDPIGNTALALLSGRYQVTPSEQTAGGTIAPLLIHQTHSMHVTIRELNIICESSGYFNVFIVFLLLLPFFSCSLTSLCQPIQAYLAWRQVSVPPLQPCES